MTTTNTHCHAGLEQITVSCRLCAADVDILIEPGTKPPVKICSRCHAGYGEKRHDSRRNRSRDTSELEYFARLFVRHDQAGPVTIYRPGDPGFAERAAQVSRRGDS